MDNSVILCLVSLNLKSVSLRNGIRINTQLFLWWPNRNTTLLPPGNDLVAVNNSYVVAIITVCIEFIDHQNQLSMYLH